MGERWAKAVASLFIREGVADTRLGTVSSGSEHPGCPEKTDACAAKNRRVPLPREEAVRRDLPRREAAADLANQLLKTRLQRIL